MRLFLAGAGNKINHIRNFMEVPGVSRVIISDVYPWSYGAFVADAAYQTPPFSAPEFLDALDRIYRHDPFDVCIPIHDASLMLFSEMQKGTRRYPFTLAMNPSETVDVISDKVRTYEFCVSHDLPTLRLWTLHDFLALGQHSFPYYLKPRHINLRGTSRARFMTIEDARDLTYVSEKLRGREGDFVVQEYATGAEINADFFCDDQGTVKSVVAVKRLAMGASRGISRGEILFDTGLRPYVERIAAHLTLWGANQVQFFVDGGGQPKILEINGRFSGSSAFVKAAGVNYFAHFIKLLKGERIDIPEEPAPLTMTSWESPHFYRESALQALP
jgi:carbamoylphosphate synthase large subunit